MLVTIIMFVAVLFFAPIVISIVVAANLKRQNDTISDLIDRIQVLEAEIEQKKPKKPLSENETVVEPVVLLESPKLSVENAFQGPPIEVGSESAETWLGQKVFGIIAATMIFVGLIFLGTLIYEKIGDDGKIILMYTIGFALTISGTILTKKSRNYFTLALAASGCGALFISTFMAHAYFGKFPGDEALTLLLIWAAGALYMSKKLGTGLFSIIAHTGIAISLFFVFSTSLSGGKLWTLLFYQWAGTAVIVGGNYLFCKKIYLPSLFTSLLLALVASSFMANKFYILDGILLLSFILQFTFASLLSYLLTRSINRLNYLKSAEAIQISNKTLWFAALCFVIYAAAVYIHNNTMNIKEDAMILASAIGIALVSAHAAISLMLEKTSNCDKNILKTSILTLSVFLAGLLIYRFCLIENYSLSGEGSVSLLFVLAIAVFCLYRSRKDKVYLVFANVYLCADLFFMLSSGYGNIYSVHKLMPPLYMFMILALTNGQLLFLNIEDKETHSDLASYLSGMKIISYIIVHASLIAFFSVYKADFRNILPTFLSTLLTLNFVLHLFKFDKNSNALRYIMVIAESVLLAACAYYISANQAPLVVLLSFALMTARANEDIKKESALFAQAFAGIKFTVLVLCTIKGFTAWLDDGYLFSIITMVTALICVLVGFGYRTKPLRVYGLIISIICVLKLATIDVSGLSTPMRVLTMIVGGLICFAINATYNYTVKNFIDSAKTEVEQ